MPTLGVQPHRGPVVQRGRTRCPTPSRWRSSRGSSGSARTAATTASSARGPDQQRRDAHRRHHAARVRRARSEGRDLAAAHDRPGDLPEHARQPLPLSDRPAEARRHARAGARRHRACCSNSGATIVPQRPRAESHEPPPPDRSAEGRHDRIDPARRSWCCRRRSASCCSSRARISRICSSRAPTRACASTRCERRSARRAAGCSASS